LTNGEIIAIMGVSSRIGFAGVITVQYFRRAATSDWDSRAYHAVCVPGNASVKQAQ